VLGQLFVKRSDHELSEEVYKTFGGVGGAISEHVKTVEEKMRRELSAKAPELLLVIFRSLVIVNPEGLPTRRRPLLSAFSEAQRPIIKLLTDERLLHTEGEGETATVSISHEKLFEAWPALRDYININKKSLMDQTLLENRARKWVEMGRPWFSGVGTGRELRDFKHGNLIGTQEMTDYLSASQRANWLWKSATGLAIFLIGVTVWLWQKGYALDQALLKLQSFLVSIHIAPEV